MEGTLHLLDSFSTQGSDGRTYKVCAFEHMVRDPSLPLDGREHWESTGRLEYRLADGTRVACEADGLMRVATTGVELHQ